MSQRNRIASRPFALALAALVLCRPLPDAHCQQKVQIKLGTVMPAGTSFEITLNEINQAWQKATGGVVSLNISAGGRQGGESNMVSKMKLGQLDAAMISAVGLSNIEASVTCLQYMPMVFRSWDELDYTSQKLYPLLEKKLLDKGFVVLFWGQAGWVRFFSKKPATSPSDFKQLKMFVWAGDSYQETLMKELGYQPVPRETEYILVGLRTPALEAVPAVPVYAAAQQIYGPAPYMLDLKWAPVSGATVIRKATWDSLPRPTQDLLREAASVIVQKNLARSRQDDDKFIAEMKKRGLQVQPVTPKIEEEWRQMAESVYPRIRGSMVPADMFDEVMRLLKEFRGARGASK